MLRRCRLWQGTFSCNGRRFHVPVPTLHLDFSEPAPSLAPLLSALQPAGAAPCFFERLELLGSLPQPAALAGCDQLHQLRELSLDFRAYTAGRELDECLAVLLQQASSQSSLGMDRPVHQCSDRSALAAHLPGRLPWTEAPCADWLVLGGAACWRVPVRCAC